MSNAYLHHPALGEKLLYFISENSLWSVPVEGGDARRMVRGDGVVSSPLLSPDGKTIAYSLDEEGSMEVYVMPSAGGEARRLTFHNAPSVPAGWSADSRTLYFASNRASGLPRVAELFEISVEGGEVSPLNIGHAVWIDVHLDGITAVVGKHSSDLAYWKRYRGGLAGSVWRGSLEDWSFEKLYDHPAGHVRPQFIGKRIYFISDRDGVGNIYSSDLKGKSLKQHTDHRNFYARFHSVRKKHIAYQCAGDLYLLDLETGKSKKIDIRLGSPLKPEKSYLVSTGKYTEGTDVSNDGKNSLFTVRGKLFSFPNWSGASRQFGVPQGVRYKFGGFLPEGGEVLCVSDESGDEELEIHYPDFKKEVKKAGGPPQGHVRDLAASRSGKKAAVATNRRQLYLVDLESAKWKLIDESRFGQWGHVNWGLTWSPDDRYIAYSKVDKRKSSIYLYDTKEEQIIRATDSEFDDLSPDFDPEGRYLYFSSLRHMDPYWDSIDNIYAYPGICKPYLLVLKQDTPVPFLVPPEPPEKSGDNGDETPEAGKKESKKENAGKNGRETPVVAIDEEGLTDRVFEFPEIKAAHWCSAIGLKNRVMLASWPMKGTRDEGGFGNLEKKDEIRLDLYDLENNSLDSYIPGVKSFTLSANREWILFRAGTRYVVKKAGEKPGPGKEKEEKAGKQSGVIDPGRIKVRVDLRREWRQMFIEAWRYQREHFWNEKMSGVDWERIRDRYLPILEKINTREELTDLLSEVQGELGTSHAYSFGGDLEKTRGYRVGLLGADFLLDRKKGLFRFSRIYQGDTFYAGKYSPLSLPGVNVKEGEYLLKVDGEDVAPGSHPNAHLIGRANSEVHLLVSKKGGLKDAREVTVKPVPSEFPLRYREWVKSNIRHVEKQTKGKAGYFHLPDMSTPGVIEFDRYFYGNIDREGLIIDVRCNGGGYISQTLLQKLYRRMVGVVRSRWNGREETLPDYTFRGSLVVIADEFAGSDGDIFPQSFKNLGMGTVVGKRTWGGVVGITINTVLVDRGIVTQPEFAIWFKEQGYGVENYGVDPDIEVENDPASVRAGKDPQLDAAVTEIKRLMKKNGYYRPEFEPIRKTSVDSK